jgi:hypothetical protein
MKPQTLLAAAALGAALAAAPALAFSPTDPAREPSRGRASAADSSEVQLLNQMRSPAPGATIRMNGMEYRSWASDPFDAAMNQLTGRPSYRDSSVTVLGIGPGSRARSAARERSAWARRAPGDHSCVDCRQSLVDGLWVLESGD